MQVTETNHDGLKREFKVVVEAAEIAEKMDARLGELQREARLPGFRPGKVPVALLRKRFGAAVRGEVIEDAVRAGAQMAIEDNALRPALQPDIEVTKADEGTDLEYTLSLEVLPDIALPDFSTLKLERLVAEVSDDEVRQAVERMAAAQKRYEAAPEGHLAERGDALVIDFVGKVEGEPFEGGSATDHQLELGSSSFVDTFEDQLMGAAAGEARTVEITFPEKYVNDALAGKAAAFDVTIKEIKRPVAVAIDDEFARNMGLEGLDALRAAVREQIEREHALLTRNRLKRSLLDALAAEHTFPVPERMVTMELDAIWKRLEHDLEHAGQSLADLDRGEEETRAEYRAIAERRVRLGLLLAEIGRNNSIEVTQDELNRAMIEQARGYPGQERAVLEFFQKNPQSADQLRAPLLEDKVVDFVLEMAQVNSTTVSLEELMRDPDEPSAESEGGAEAAETPKKKGKPKRGKSKAAKAENE